MTSRHSRIFKGLVRPPQVWGLPVLYWVPVLSVSILPLIWFQSALGMAVLFLMLWTGARVLARFEPRILDLMSVSGRMTRKTGNHRVWGGNRYEP